MTQFPPTTRLACYPRVSTEEQKLRGLSIEAQTEALQAWADRNGIKDVTFYNDAGNSARKPYNKRPAMLRLLSDVRAGRIDLIIFTKLDRWFRNIAEYYKVQEILEAHNVAWKAIQEDYDTSTASGRLKINIMLSVAQDEADRTSERIKAVLARKKERSEPVSGHVPTGYRIVGKQVVKDPATEAAVSAYFTHYLEYGSITRAIDHVASRYGLHLKYQLASSILQKTAYCGDFNGVSCPAYITREQHEAILASRRRTARKTKNDRVYLFSGLLVCGACGARMGGRAHKYKGLEFIEYNCPGHYQKKGCPNRTNIREEDIERYLLENIERAAEQAEATYQERAQLERRDYSGEIAAVKKKLVRLKELYLNELIDLQAYRADYEELNGKLAVLTTEQQKRPPDFKAVRKALNIGWRTVYAQLDRARRRAFWRGAVREVRVYPDRHIEFSVLER